MHAQWKLRSLLADELLRQLKVVQASPSRQGASVVPDVWTSCSLHYFFRFLSNCALRQREAFAPSENDQYNALLDVYSGTGGVLEQQYKAIQRKLLSVFGEVKPKFEEGVIPRQTLALLTPDHDVNAGDTRPVGAVKELLDRVAVILALDGVLANSEHPEYRDSLGKVLDNNLSELRRALYQEGYLWTSAEKREAIARLLWAHIVRDEKKFEAKPALLNSWWLLLQDFERLEVSDSCSAHDFDLEANSLSNIMRFAIELELLAHIAKRGGRGRHDDQGELNVYVLDELRGYVRDILVDRMPMFSESFSALLERAGREEGETLTLANVALALKVMLQYYNLILSPGIRRLRRIDSAIRDLSTIELSEDGCHYPASPAWNGYRRKCESVGRRIESYVEACRKSGKRDKLKPFVILVVGEPGTGKSQFVDSIVKPRLHAKTEIVADLSQSVSVSKQLESIWKALHLRNKDGIALLVLEEFDSEVGAKVEQYRHVLRPLWDAQSYVVDPDGVETVSLGPFVAICIMSKMDTFASARRVLTGLDKGLDFLTRVDVVVEIPPFDRVETQVELILVSLARRASGGSLHISQIALWFLGWLQTGDNFRAISKALKTVGESMDFISYKALNVDPRLRLDFEMLLAEFSQVGSVEMEELLANEERNLALQVTTSDSKVEFSCTEYLREALEKRKLELLAIEHGE